MNKEIIGQTINVIRTERQRRIDELKDQDPDFASDRWESTDKPFINDMCLLVLVALSHHVERELVSFAARAGEGVPTIPGDTYDRNLKRRRNDFKNPETDLRIKLPMLTFNSCDESIKTIDALRLLANCYKHEPTERPGKCNKLLTLLGLPAKPIDEFLEVDYATLPESDLFRKGLAVFVNLPGYADYCTIAETFLAVRPSFWRRFEPIATWLLSGVSFRLPSVSADY